MYSVDEVLQYYVFLGEQDVLLSTLLKKIKIILSYIHRQLHFFFSVQ